jgi:hypothetical protein
VPILGASAIDEADGIICIANNMNWIALPVGYEFALGQC